jgi:hypothetical protein
MKCVLCCEGSDFPTLPEEIKKYEAAAAKAAREQVLDKIMWYMANHGVEKRPEGYYVVSGTFSLGGFIKHIESLRAHQPQGSVSE